MVEATPGTAKGTGSPSVGNEDKMRRLIEIFLLGAALLVQPFLFAQSTIVSASKVLDNTGSLLSSGKLCVGSTCLTVTAGAIPSTAIVSTTANVTITNGGSITYLTLPNVPVSGPYWSFDIFIVPSSMSITGIGTPRISCQPGAIYTQTDGDQNKWVCVDINGVGTWNGVLPVVSDGGGGTVTSVGISLPSIFCVSGSPVTSSGTIQASLCDEPANTVFAGPSSGSASSPSFRSLAVSDMPFTYSGNTTKLATVAGGLTQGLALTADANGNIITAGAGTVLPGTINAAQVAGLAPSATIDTTNASNIATGTLNIARLPEANFTCPSGQVVSAFTLNTANPTCVPFQGVVTSGQQYELPMYSISGGGTTLSSSQLSSDANGDLNVGLVNAAGTGTLPGYGSVINFHGGPAPADYNSDNSDPMWMGRYNAGDDVSELRINLSDNTLGDSDPCCDRLRVGTTAAGYNLFVVDSDGRAAVNRDIDSGFNFSVNGALNATSYALNGNAISYSGNTTKLATVSGAFTAGDGVQVDGNGNLVDSGRSAASGSILASVSFTSCVIQDISDTDKSCVGSQNWPSTLSTVNYSVICTVGLSGFSGGSSGMTKTTWGWTSKSATSFGYYVGNDHSGSAGNSVSMDCIAVAN
jgi:hypothetical protein